MLHIAAKRHSWRLRKARLHQRYLDFKRDLKLSVFVSLSALKRSRENFKSCLKSE